MPKKKRGTKAPKKRPPPAIRIVDARRGPGRPTKYALEHAHIAEVMCKVGATDIEVARALNISTWTLYRWKSLHPEFCEALKVGKDAADDRVEKSLFSRAVGYEHDATKILQNGKQVISVEYVEHYPPDPTSAIFWLKNRRPTLYRDRHEVATEIVNKPHQEMTEAELEEEMRKEQERLARAEAAEAARRAAEIPPKS